MKFFSLILITVFAVLSSACESGVSVKMVRISSLETQKNEALDYSPMSHFAEAVKNSLESGSQIIAWGQALLPPDNTPSEWVLWENFDFVVYDFSQPMNSIDLLEKIGDTGWSPYLLIQGKITSLQMTAKHYAKNQKCGFSNGLPYIDAESVSYQCYLFERIGNIRMKITGTNFQQEKKLVVSQQQNDSLF